MSKRSARRRAMLQAELQGQGVTLSDGKVAKLYTLDGGRRDDRGRPAPQQKFTKNITPKSAGQKRFLQALEAHNLVLGLGPAGTGKTFLAVCQAVAALEAGQVSKIILTRPAVEAGESIGFLPGAMEDKLAPYLRPLMDVLSQRMSGKKVKALLAEGVIEIAPVAFMRGRTFNDAFVVLDEAQNCTYTQLKMVMTRLGWGSTMAITGDPHQSDLADGQSGLREVADRLKKAPSAKIIRLDKRDIVRHPIVAEVLAAL